MINIHGHEMGNFLNVLSNAKVSNIINIFNSCLQTIFIISVCNNQLLNWIENELIWGLSFIPGVASILPNLVAKLNAMRDKYMTASPAGESNVKVNFSLTYYEENITQTEIGINSSDGD